MEKANRKLLDRPGGSMPFIREEQAHILTSTWYIECVDKMPCLERLR